ncbi:unnamed protein product [Bursaphelenchus okinawaensis]|uniref:HTH TFE/IIEalpha-type domain-containing protein n=1 Tax=Bursaphelenchus okinawaensis TaxID=465554 RepID=A0A811KTJ0_9BILA|nr:unnamed protein product [Bursaphelenchus okinawaensis]CAG9111646.1 unnamed protein product [Bursaphelenchus okinawaensis]
MDGGEGSTIITEIPENLKNLCLLLTKTFYTLPHYVVLDYVQKLGCVKEDRLRDILKLEPKTLRGLIVTLKVDKFLKERTIAEETDGRSRKVNYYHVNYKAILNVTKYKIDHMRQRLEHREQTHVQKASYVCSTCKRCYDALDVQRIMNMETGELMCWQCNGQVVPDETAGPSEETRSSLAKFNDEMAAIFSMLQQLDGIRFARQILEPPIIITKDEPQEAERNGNALQVGARMFSNAEKTRSDLYGNGIMVSIGERQEIQVESKEKVPWLQHNTHEEAVLNGLEEPSMSALNGSSLHEEKHADEESLLAQFLGEAATIDIGTLLHNTEGVKELHTENSSPARSINHSVSGEENNHDVETQQNGFEKNGTQLDEDLFVAVQGRQLRFEDLNQELVDLMTEKERQFYIDLVVSSVFF